LTIHRKRAAGDFFPRKEIEKSNLPENRILEYPVAFYSKSKQCLINFNVIALIQHGGINSLFKRGVYVSLRKGKGDVFIIPKSSLYKKSAEETLEHENYKTLENGFCENLFKMVELGSEGFIFLNNMFGKIEKYYQEKSEIQVQIETALGINKYYAKMDVLGLTSVEDINFKYGITKSGNGVQVKKRIVIGNM